MGVLDFIILCLTGVSLSPRPALEASSDEVICITTTRRGFNDGENNDGGTPSVILLDRRSASPIPQPS